MGSRLRIAVTLLAIAALANAGGASAKAASINSGSPASAATEDASTAMQSNRAPVSGCGPSFTTGIRMAPAARGPCSR